MLSNSKITILVFFFLIILSFIRVESMNTNGFIKLKGRYLDSYRGYDIEQKSKTNNFNKCRKICENNKICQAFTFAKNSRKKGGRCWLKKGGWNEKDLYEDIKYNLHVKKNYVNELDINEFEKYENIYLNSYKNFDIGGTRRVNSINKCRKICKNNKRCQAFTFKDKRCWLKKAGWDWDNVDNNTGYDLHVKKNYVNVLKEIKKLKEKQKI